MANVLVRMRMKVWYDDECCVYLSTQMSIVFAWRSLSVLFLGVLSVWHSCQCFFRFGFVLLSSLTDSLNLSLSLIMIVPSHPVSASYYRQSQSQLNTTE